MRLVVDLQACQTGSRTRGIGRYSLALLRAMARENRGHELIVALNGSLNEDLRRNIRERGAECLEKFTALAAEMGDRVTGVQGTGLLFSVGLDSSRFKAYGAGSVEEYMRLHGINVIHGGENSLRFTPHFRITSEEIDLLIEHYEDLFQTAPTSATTRLETAYTSAAPAPTASTAPPSTSQAMPTGRRWDVIMSLNRPPRRGAY